MVDIWLTVLLQERLRYGRMPSRLEGRRFLARFDKGYCLLFNSENEQDNRKAAAWIRPKVISRADTRTILLDTGYTNFGKLVFGFDSVQDTDKADAELRGMLPEA